MKPCKFEECCVYLKTWRKMIEVCKNNAIPIKPDCEKCLLYEKKEVKKKMNIDNLKLVRHDIYCERCKFYQIAEEREPCATCLGVPVREGSEKPTMYQEVVYRGGK